MVLFPTAASTLFWREATTAVGTSLLTCTATDWLTTAPGVFSTCERIRSTPLRVLSEPFL